MLKCYDLKPGSMPVGRQQPEAVATAAGQTDLRHAATSFGIDQLARGAIGIEIKLKHTIRAAVLPNFGRWIDASEVRAANQRCHLCRRQTVETAEASCAAERAETRRQSRMNGNLRPDWTRRRGGTGGEQYAGDSCRKVEAPRDAIPYPRYYNA